MKHRIGSLFTLVLAGAALTSAGCNKDKEECHKLGLEVKAAYVVYGELEHASQAKDKAAFASKKTELDGLLAKVSKVELTSTKSLVGESNAATKKGFVERMPAAISYLQKYIDEGAPPTREEIDAHEAIKVHGSMAGTGCE